jgi:hypothetical protein
MNDESVFVATLVFVEPELRQAYFPFGVFAAFLAAGLNARTGGFAVFLAAAGLVLTDEPRSALDGPLAALFLPPAGDVRCTSVKRVWSPIV